MTKKECLIDTMKEVSEHNVKLRNIIAADMSVILEQRDRIRQLEMEVQELNVALLLRDRERENNREIKIREINEIARMWGE